MKAIEYHTYGSPEVLQIVEREIPTPKDNEILVKVFATTVTATEATFRQGKPYFSRLFTGLTKPKIKTLGEELAGEVIKTGKAVTLFKKGDRIFGTAGPTFGANAEYITLPEDAVIVPLPSNLNYEESASACDGFLTALPFLRDTGKIKQGQKVLIYGASGSVGSSAIQVAKYYGAEVTGVCSTTNLELVSSLGADHVIDYKNEDFTKNGQQYDIIFDAVGKTTFSKAKNALKKEGRFLEAGIGLNVFGHVLITALFGKKKALIAATGLRPPVERTKDLHLLRSLLEEGRIKPVIDKTYSLSKIAEAHRYVDQGHKRGNVVIRVV
ncbi:NAD(P)-dependent alcohol dehydrogenase [Roseivirga echinicomitans]|uniref:Zn-dependent oxidoreductase n=1 Tax=Roseivirga echinicomitans TaxID=296218 RepID=A0A150X9N7_9BACT|nr:NAD(P)-dependent alcohol dehydrogenase [Roseivirga echinicomitans]KYG75372.1 Zn-dependent oxidoreductase [Roseivirga echinicomitans]